ncbi:MAG: orotidine-5'-phosphate decarboxylase [Tissierella sp.]|nr:orotidine-5'-phosphate decarboxylase [Tissierella sp.]
MEKVIVALDFEYKEEVIKFLDLFKDESIYVKVGMELYYQSGPEFIKEIKDRGHNVFLDLKLHDIPNTVERAMRIISKFGVDMVNVHAAGGLEMMKAARNGLGNEILLIAVTQLTSTSEKAMKRDQLISVSLNESVIHYAKLTKEAELDGVVCSPLESRMIHEATSNDFLTVTPGIRLSTNDKQDQVRITSPAKANTLGSDYIVVGRPITRAANPKDVYFHIVDEFKKGE